MHRHRTPRGAAYREAVSRLGSAQKSPYAVPPYTRYVNRPVGRRLAAAAAVARMTPNGVTAVSMVSSGLGLVWLCVGPSNLWHGPVVAAFLLWGYALDSADGQLARLLGRGGPAGEWLDHVSDQARTVAMHMAVMIWVYRVVGPPAWVYLVPMTWAVVVSTRFLSQILAEQFRRSGAAREHDPAADPGAARRAVLQLPSDNGVICLWFVTVGLPVVFLVGYGLLLVANTALTVASLRRRYAELSAPRA